MVSELSSGRFYANGRGSSRVVRGGLVRLVYGRSRTLGSWYGRRGSLEFWIEVLVGCMGCHLGLVNELVGFGRG